VCIVTVVVKFVHVAFKDVVELAWGEVVRCKLRIGHGSGRQRYCPLSTSVVELQELGRMTTEDVYL